MQQFDRVEKFLLYNTLNCVPQILRGYSVLIDLRNESSVAGRIESADGHMNIHLVDVVYIDRNGLQYPFDEFMIRERMIRQIHIPHEIDVDQALRDWIENGMRPKKLVKSGNRKRTFKQKRAEMRHKEILKTIAMEKAQSSEN